MKISPTSRFGWFWYNDQEIWFDDEKAIAKKIEPFAKQGITHLITFSCTHFRWNFQPYWAQINDCIGRIVRAAHHYDIKVIEHHSSHLTNYPINEEAMKGFRWEFSNRKGNVDNWLGLMDFMLDDTTSYMERRQINFEGKPAWTPYGGFGQCFNNQAYVNDYLQYLKSVYAQGVDGIMTDDVQYYGESCFCPICQKLFYEQYHMELPLGQEWKKVSSDIRSPLYQAFKQFQANSLLNFHQHVADHYSHLGFDFLRPNYISNALSSGMTPFCIDKLPELDIIFQECCFPTFIRYCWPDYLMEELHRAMSGRIRNIPHMMMFYATRKDSLIFSWGLSKIAGAMYTNTPEGESFVDETTIRNFEKRYWKLCFSGTPFKGVAFLDSRKNCMLGPSYLCSKMFFWINSCTFHNIPAALVSIDHSEEFFLYPVLVVNEVSMLTCNEIRKLKQYAFNGGILVVSGVVGDLDEHAKMRNDKEYFDLWGFDKNPDPLTEENIPWGKGKIIRLGSAFGFPGTQEEKSYLFDNYPNRFKADSIYELMSKRKHIHWIWCHPDSSNSCVDNENNYGNGKKYFKIVADFLSDLLGKSLTLKTRNFPDLVVAAAFNFVENRTMVVHLLNCNGTLPEEKGHVLSHQDKIPFPPLENSGKIYLTLPGELKNQKFKTVMHCLTKDEELDNCVEDNELIINVHRGAFEDYGLIEINCL